MPTLHLGVIDVPHGNPPKASLKGKLKASTVITTGMLASFLEEKYHPMGIFFELYEKRIAKELEDSYAGELESVLMGAPLRIDPAGSATNQIEEWFKLFIDRRELERLGYPGIPTQAALDGVNHSLQHPYAKANPRRASLVDTGQYRDNFKAWMT